jgi:hypothetical protein
VLACAYFVDVRYRAGVRDCIAHCVRSCVRLRVPPCVWSLTAAFVRARGQGPLALSNAIRAGFLNLDAEHKTLPQIRTGEDHSGCTGIGVMITPTHFIAGNVG